MKTGTIELQRDSGRVFDGYLAAPESGRNPAIMILSEMFGVNGPMRGFAEHYAGQGHCVLVPNVFWRSETSAGLDYDERGFDLAWARIRNFDIDAAAGDMRRAAEALRAQPSCNGKVAALGFCMGGRLAYVAAARSGVDAAIGLYGLNISKHLHEVPAIKVPVHLHYADKDEHVPLAEVEAVEQGVRSNPNIVIYRYPEAGHSFFNKVRPTYDPAAAAVAAKRIDALLASM